MLAMKITYLFVNKVMKTPLFYIYVIYLNSTFILKTINSSKHKINYIMVRGTAMN